MTVRGHAYERRGLLCIDPKAFWEVFFCDESPKENTELEGCAIVDIRGPLEQHAHPWCDSYEAIIARVALACESSAQAVILRFDSPGGDAAGCFEAATELRRMCDAAGKQLHAYVDGDCCSAAYALASHAQSITMSVSSLVGSIGVLSCRDDLSARNAANGLRVALITSGARKADGHPDQPISDAELQNTQAIVDSMAGVFFQLVAEGRALTPKAVAQLEAKVFHGQAAVDAGLADAVGPLSTVLATVAGVANGAENMAATAYEKARALLQEAAEGDDANAAAAKAALAAMEPPKQDDDKKDDDKKEEPAAASAAAPDDDKQAAADDKDPKALAAAAMRAALKAQQDNATLRAEIKRRDEKEERDKLIASRPSLAPEMVALLQKAPMELVRETIAATPTSSPTTPTLERAPLRGETTGVPVGQQSAEAKAKMDARMGITAAKPTVQQTEYTQTFGVRYPGDSN